MARVRIIESKNSGPTPLAYDLAPGQTIETLCVAADFDGSGAAGDFLPCVAFYAQDGRRLGRFASDPTVPAGSSAEATFFPFAPPASAGSGIEFDKLNQGGALDIHTKDSGYSTVGFHVSDESTSGIAIVQDANGPILVNATGSGGLIVRSDGNGDLLIEQTGNALLRLENDGNGGTQIGDFGNGGLLIQATNAPTVIDMTNTNDLRIPGLPGADPGFSGSVWYDPADGNRMKYTP